MSGEIIRVDVRRDIVTGEFVAYALWLRGDSEWGAKGKAHPSVGAAVYSLGDSLCRLQREHPEWFPMQSEEASRSGV